MKLCPVCILKVSLLISVNIEIKSQYVKMGFSAIPGSCKINGNSHLMLTKYSIYRFNQCKNTKDMIKMRYLLLKCTKG